MKQYTIFDYPTTCSIERKEPLLKVGQTVYKVSRKEITEYVVNSTYSVKDCETPYYTLKRPTLHTFATAKDPEVNESVFLDKEKAEEAAKRYEQTHAMWLSSSVCFKEAKCFSAIRKTDGRRLLMWYGLVPGPLGEESKTLVLKEYMTFIHAITFESEEKARKWLEKTFMPQVEEHGFLPCDTCEDIHIPNLYPCNKNSNWDWSEDGYSGIEEKIIA